MIDPHSAHNGASAATVSNGKACSHGVFLSQELRAQHRKMSLNNRFRLQHLLIGRSAARGACRARKVRHPVLVESGQSVVVLQTP